MTVIVELVFLVTTAIFTSPFLYASTTSLRAGASPLDQQTAFAPQLAPFQINIIDRSGPVSPPDTAAKPEEARRARIKHKHLLVVFVHGTMYPIPTLDAMGKWVKNNFSFADKNLKYEDLLRDESANRLQPIGPLGFAPIVPEWSPRANGAQLMSWLIQEMYAMLPQDEYKRVHAYTFGWDGALSLPHRRRQSKVLLEGIADAFEKLKKQYPLEEIEIAALAHSHGGGLIAFMLDWLTAKINFKINYVCFFGMPIHGETEFAPASPFFERVYHFFALSDLIQIADVLSTEKYIPERIFKQPAVIETGKVKQIQVEQANRFFTHSDFWFFQWPPSLWSQNVLPIEPLPLAAFTPLILYELKKARHDEHFFKLTIDALSSKTAVRVQAFKDYMRDELIRFYQYEDHFDFSHLLAQLPRIKNE